MAAAGVELVVDQRELAVGGVFEALTSLPRVMRAWRRMVASLRRFEPDLVVLIDSGGFNLPFARRVRRQCRARILYYAAPQIWAWRPGRIRKLADRCDRIAVILPFEREFYAEQGVDTEFVGHPLLDRFQSEAGDSCADRRRRARDRIGVSADATLLGLFPGSRRSEIGLHLPLFIETLAALRRERPDLQALIVRAPSLDSACFDAEVVHCARSAGLGGDALRVVPGDSSDALDAIDGAVTKPGTITVELLLRACPMVVVGRVHPWTARIVRRSIRVAYLSMPNLLLGERIVPEYLQEEARPDRIAEEVAPLLEPGERRERQIADLARARTRLGDSGASRRCAEIAEDLLGNSPE